MPNRDDIFGEVPAGPSPSGTYPPKKGSSINLQDHIEPHDHHEIHEHHQGSPSSVNMNAPPSEKSNHHARLPPMNITQVSSPQSDPNIVEGYFGKFQKVAAFSLIMGMFVWSQIDSRDRSRSNEERINRSEETSERRYMDLREQSMKQQEQSRTDIREFWTNRQDEIKQSMKHAGDAVDTLRQFPVALDKNTEAVKEMTRVLTGKEPKTVVPKAKTSSGAIPLPREKDESQ